MKLEVNDKYKAISIFQGNSSRIYGDRISAYESNIIGNISTAVFIAVPMNIRTTNTISDGFTDKAAHRVITLANLLPSV
jgi:hypothetical protein